MSDHNQTESVILFGPGGRVEHVLLASVDLTEMRERRRNSVRRRRWKRSDNSPVALLTTSKICSRRRSATLNCFRGG